VLSGLTISNGLAFSPDGRTMYHTDTPTLTIHAYDFDPASGTPANRRVFAAFTAETDRPDGAAVDSEGCYWTALYRGGRVVRLSPAGRVLAEYAVPAMCPTMCAFGGADLRTLYVTTARQFRDADELARLPQSGGLFALQVDVPGCPEPAFAG
jgi:sugar lactone lactonase YvrE